MSADRYVWPTAEQIKAKKEMGRPKKEPTIIVRVSRRSFNHVHEEKGVDETFPKCLDRLLGVENE